MELSSLTFMIKSRSATGAAHRGAIGAGLQPERAGVLRKQRVLDSDDHVEVTGIPTGLQRSRHVHQACVRSVLRVSLDRAKIVDEVAQRLIGRSVNAERTYQIKIENEPPQRRACWTLVASSSLMITSAAEPDSDQLFFTRNAT